MLTRILTVQLNDGSQILSYPVVSEAGAASDIDESYPSSGSNAPTAQLTAFALDVSQLKQLLIAGDGALKVETNASPPGTSGQTISLVANEPIAWNAASGLTNPLTIDVTKLYVTNSSSATVTLKIRSLVDPTV